MNDTKKELGQHWLTDEGILTAIADAAQVTHDDRILEIGPGKGTLTAVLSNRASTVTALEFDADLLGMLRSRFSGSNVTIEQGDIRKFNFNTFPHPYKIVANIPYYLTSHLIRAISETENPPTVAVLLVQKEVAERLCAGPGQMSILAVTAQFYFDCSLGIPVPAHYFMPAPKVDSQVVVLKRRVEPLFDVDPQAYFKVVKAGFSVKRKTLKNAFSGGLMLSKADTLLLLESAGIRPTARAQELSLDEWFRCFLKYTDLYGSR